MPEKEKTERHRNNMNHIKTHTSAAWADNFISELNDTHMPSAGRVPAMAGNAGGRVTRARVFHRSREHVAQC